MIPLALLVTVSLAAEGEPSPDVWAGEERTVHFDVGVRVHGGIMDAGGYPLWILQSEILGILSIRLHVHDELRVQLGLSGGWPDTAGGESSVSFLHSLSPRVAVGIGGFVYL